MLLDADLQLSGRAPGAAVEFVGHATGQPDVDAPARGSRQEPGLVGLAPYCAAGKPCPVAEPFGMQHTDIETAVGWIGLREQGDAAEKVTDVADEYTRRRAENQSRSSTHTSASTGAFFRFFRPV